MHQDRLPGFGVGAHDERLVRGEVLSSAVGLLLGGLLLETLFEGHEGVALGHVELGGRPVGAHAWSSVEGG